MCPACIIKEISQGLLACSNVLGWLEGTSEGADLLMLCGQMPGAALDLATLEAAALQRRFDTAGIKEPWVEEVLESVTRRHDEALAILLAASARIAAIAQKGAEYRDNDVQARRYGEARAHLGVATDLGAMSGVYGLGGVVESQH